MSDRLPHEKGFHISWDQIHRDSRALAWRLDKQGPDDGEWRAVVAITRGGMAPAMIVSRELGIRTVDTISVQSYNHQTQTEAQVLKAPDAALMGDGTGILIVDELHGQGANALAIHDDRGGTVKLHHIGAFGIEALHREAARGAGHQRGDLAGRTGRSLPEHLHGHARERMPVCVAHDNG